MSSRQIFIDANVLLEVILSRKHEVPARRALTGIRDNGFLSALSAHLVIHFGQERVSLKVLRQVLEAYRILPLEEVDFEWAFNNTQNDDFEDALQLAVAIRHGCSEFITFNRTLYNAYRHLPLINIKLVAQAKT